MGVDDDTLVVDQWDEDVIAEQLAATSAEEEVYTENKQQQQMADKFAADLHALQQQDELGLQEHVVAEVAARCECGGAFFAKDQQRFCLPEFYTWKMAMRGKSAEYVCDPATGRWVEKDGKNAMRG